MVDDIMIVLFLLLIPPTISFSCHSCSSMWIEEVSEDIAKEYNTKYDRCVDNRNLDKCSTYRMQSKCQTDKLEMKEKCNRTCDLCRFKQNGEIQDDDIQYWNDEFIYNEKQFNDNFRIINLTMFNSESSSVRDDLVDLYGPNNTIDGNLSSFSWTKYEGQPYIVVFLGVEMLVHYVIVINRWGDDVGRDDTLSLDGADISALYYPPGGGSGNVTLCGTILMREGISLERQSYRIVCNGFPKTTHVKLYRSDYSSLQVSEIKVGVTDNYDQCGSTMTVVCNATLNSDKCYKLDYEGIWHGKALKYSHRGCYYTSQPNTTDCGVSMSLINAAKFSHLRSSYDIDAYDPNSFQLAKCEKFICKGSDCNTAFVAGLSSLYVNLLFILLLML